MSDEVCTTATSPEWASDQTSARRAGRGKVLILLRRPSGWASLAEACSRGAGAGIAAAGGAFARAWLWGSFRWTEDFLPGEPPNVALVPEAWTTTADEVTFAVLGDNGSGGRNAMDVARAMATAYQHTPYGLVLLAGDISYYGSIDDRWQDVFVRPYRPLIDAGVRWSWRSATTRSPRSTARTPPERSPPSSAGLASPAPSTWHPTGPSTSSCSTPARLR